MTINTAYSVTEDVSAVGGPLMDCFEVICQHHHQPCPRPSLLSGQPMKNGLLSPSAISSVAKRAGFVSRTVKRPLEQINPALLPAILILHHEQCCVVHAYDSAKNTLTVTYPELQQHLESVPLSSVDEQYSGYVIFLRPKIQQPDTDSQHTPAEQNNWFWKTIAKARPLYRDVLIASAFISLLSVAMPLFVMNVYDRVVPNAALETLWMMAIGVLIALLSDLLLRFLRYYFVELAASRVDVHLSSTLLQKVLAISFSEKPRSTGSFVNSIQSFDAIRTFLNSVTIVALIDLPFACLFMGIIIFIDWHLVLPILVGGIVVIGYGFYCQSVMKQLADDSMKIGARKNALITESLTNFDDVRFFNTQSHFQYEFEKQSIFLAKTNAKLRLVGASVSNLASLVQQLVGVCIVITGVYLIVEGELTQGALIAAYLLSGRAMGPLGSTASLAAQFHHAKTSLTMLNDIMAMQVDKPASKQWTEHEAVKGEIKFEDVTFHYPDHNQFVVNKVSFNIKAGEKVAILGKNGSGKSTINKLLMRAYAPSKGLISVDGINILQYEPSALRRHIGYVPQDLSLFAGSLKDNITRFDDSIDEDEIWQVLEQCELAALVNNHPDGLNLNVGEKGALLSGGKRQAVAIARALIHSPDIFILDEPTAAMDSNTEARLKAVLKARTQDKTLILNTHRTTLLDLVDRIIVVDHGKVLIDGPKQHVLNQLQAVLSQQPGVRPA